MGRISDALSKIKLNDRAAEIPFSKMAAKDMIKLFYHLAEVYDAETLIPEVTVKKKLKVFKNFARVHSLSHLLPPVKHMKHTKKCTRLVNNLLDMLEEKYSKDLYTRQSWPVACKELPKIENTISFGSYNFDHLDLNPDAVPPGASGTPTFPGVKTVPTPVVTKPSPAEESGAKLCVSSVPPTDDVIKTKASPILSSAAGVAIRSDPDTTKAVSESQGKDALIKPGNHDVPNTTSVPRNITAESINDGMNMNMSKEKPEVNSSKDQTNSVEPPRKTSPQKKRQLDQSFQTSGSQTRQKKLKTEKTSSEHFIEAIEDLSNSRSIVEVIGWSKAIFTNQRIWHAIQNLVYARVFNVLLGKELRKCKVKKVETAMGIKVIMEKKVSNEYVKTIEVKLEKLMKQIRNAVPDELSENMKSAVDSSCENVKFKISNANQW